MADIFEKRRCQDCHRETYVRDLYVTRNDRILCESCAFDEEKSFLDRQPPRLRSKFASDFFGRHIENDEITDDDIWAMGRFKPVAELPEEGAII